MIFYEHVGSYSDVLFVEDRGLSPCSAGERYKQCNDKTAAIISF